MPDEPQPGMSVQDVFGRAAANADARGAGEPEVSPQPAAPAPAPETPPPATPTPEAPAQEPVQSPTPTPPDVFYETQVEGEKVGLTKEETDYLVNLAIKGLRGAKETPPPAVPEKEAAPEIPPEVQKILDSYAAPLKGEIAQLKTQLANRETKEQAREIVDSCVRAMGKHKVFSTVGDDETLKHLAQHQVMTLWGNTGVSWEQAAKTVAEKWEALEQRISQKYVQAKVTQAANRVEGSGGAVPAPGQKKLGASDLFNGKVQASALARFQRHLAGAKG